MIKLSARLEKLEAVNTTQRLITVAVNTEAEIAPLLAKHGIDRRPKDLLVTVPAGGRGPTLIQFGSEVYAAGHALEGKLHPRATQYDIPPYAA